MEVEEGRIRFWKLNSEEGFLGGREESPVRKSKQQREVESGRSVGPDNKLVLKLMNHTIKLWESF